MKTNLKILLTVISAGAVMFSGCSNEEELPIENVAFIEEGNVKPAEKAESTQPTAILGSGGTMSALLSQTFTNIVESAKAKNVIVACSDLDAYKDDILLAYQKGAIITVTDPDAAALNAWCEANGMVYPGDPTAEDACALVSFNRKAASISIQKKKKKDQIEEEDVPLVIFTGWLDKILTPNMMGPDYRSRDIKKRITPQHASHVFSFELSREVLDKTNWVIPEEASLTTTAELNCDIYPLHSFAENASFSGDIYVVEGELTLHNGNLFNGKWQYNKGKHLYEVCGFYLSECWMTSSLKNSSAYQLMGDPSPATTDLSTPYQSGLEWNFDGWLTGGNGLESTTPTPMQEGGWTWNNLQEAIAVEGLDILNNTESSRPSWGLRIYPIPYEKDMAIPDIATGDLTFRFTWIWGVPDAVDNSTGRYYMNVNLTPQYLWHRAVLPEKKVETDYIMPEGDRSHTFMLIPPCRTEGQRVNM